MLEALQPALEVVTDPNRVFFVVPCMGRRQFIQRTLPVALSKSTFRYCLVDYSCPEQVGNWVERTQPLPVESARVVICRVPGQEYFCKSAAHNAGARLAIELGAEYLCFMDADTLLVGGAADWLTSHLSSQTFVIVGLTSGIDVPDLFGFMALSSQAYIASGGYDECFRGWGGEDTEFRFRLLLKQGLSFQEIPRRFLGFIQHARSLRTANYEEKDYQLSNRQNLARVAERIEVWVKDAQVPPEHVERLHFHSRDNRFLPKNNPLEGGLRVVRKRKRLSRFAVPKASWG